MEDRSQAFLPILGGLLLSAAAALAQTRNPRQPIRRLPYSFGNFVWWSDDELRSLLKKRIPAWAMRLRRRRQPRAVRDALKALLKEKGLRPRCRARSRRTRRLVGCATRKRLRLD